MFDILFDVETDGLLDTLTRIWILVAKDLPSKKVYIFCDLPGNFPSGATVLPMREAKHFFSRAKRVSGHNILAFDLIVISRLLGIELSKETEVVDTLIMSQVLDYRRFGFQGHSMSVWGSKLGVAKQEHEEWDRFSDEMITRCVSDVNLNELILNTLVKELSNHPHQERIKLGLRVEHKLSEFCRRSTLHGFPFDREAAEKLQTRLKRIVEEHRNYLLPLMSTRVKPKDGFNEESNFKVPRWVKSGDYHKDTCTWFELPSSAGQEDKRPIWGAYCRTEFIEPDPNSDDSLKLFLTSIGWEPDEWNYTKVDRFKFIKTSPKLTESSLVKMGEIGRVIIEFSATSSRLSILNTWIEKLDSNNRLHGQIRTIGTETGRAAHEGIANLPKADVELFRSDGKAWVKVKGGDVRPDYNDPLPFKPATIGPEGTYISVAETPWGPQIRALFSAIPGFKLVGADSSGNQFRGLCHYLGPEAAEYTREGIEGDIHTLHANILSEVVPGTSRGTAKPWFYAYIFGGGDAKLGTILTGRADAKIGKASKQLFRTRIPGFDRLLRLLNTQLSNTAANGAMYIPAIDGRRVYLQSEHKALNYLLQSCEKVTCAAATAIILDELDKAGIEWQPCVFYHDEVQFMVKEEHAEMAAAIAEKAFEDGPKMFGVNIMAGKAKIGNNWRDTH